MLYVKAERIKVRIERLIWLDDMVEKLAKKHGVLQDEVKEVLEGKPSFRFVEKGHRPDENVYAAMGRTQTGRYLIIFYIYKKKDALILSARDMTQAERKKYAKT
jgi:uncharacterized protein